MYISNHTQAKRFGTFQIGKIILSCQERYRCPKGRKFEIRKKRSELQLVGSRKGYQRDEKRS